MLATMLVRPRASTSRQPGLNLIILFMDGMTKLRLIMPFPIALLGFFDASPSDGRIWTALPAALAAPPGPHRRSAGGLGAGRGLAVPLTRASAER
jgi:hypothetical protein